MVNELIHHLNDSYPLIDLTNVWDQDSLAQIHKERKPDWSIHHLNDHLKNSLLIGKTLPDLHYNKPRVIHPKHLLSLRSFLSHPLTFEKLDQYRSSSRIGG